MDIDGEAPGDWSGGSVSLSSDGSTVAIGAPGNDGNGTENAGHVRIYRWTDGTSWVQLGMDIDGEAANDYSGYIALSSDGSTVAIGAFENEGNGNNAGHVRVFKINLPAGAAFGGELKENVINLSITFFFKFSLNIIISSLLPRPSFQTHEWQLYELSWAMRHLTLPH